MCICSDKRLCIEYYTLKSNHYEVVKTVPSGETGSKDQLEQKIRCNEQNPTNAYFLLIVKVVEERKDSAFLWCGMSSGFGAGWFDAGEKSGHFLRLMWIDTIALKGYRLIVFLAIKIDAMGAVKILDKEINHYLGHLNTHQKEVVLSVVKTFAQEENDWWDAVEESAGESIKRGLKQADSGQVIPHEEVMKKYKKWLSK